MFLYCSYIFIDLPSHTCSVFVVIWKDNFCSYWSSSKTGQYSCTDTYMYNKLVLKHVYFKSKTLNVIHTCIHNMTSLLVKINFHSLIKSLVSFLQLEKKHQYRNIKMMLSFNILINFGISHRCS